MMRSKTWLRACPARYTATSQFNCSRRVHDGVVFGLIDESGDRVGDGSHVNWVEMYPDRLGFHEPWDGLYDT